LSGIEELNRQDAKSTEARERKKRGVRNQELNRQDAKIAKEIRREIREKYNSRFCFQNNF
jgi:hypothetical protein